MKKALRAANLEFIPLESALETKSLAGMLADSSLPVEEQAMAASLRKILEDLLEGFSPRDAEVLRLRFGLSDGDEHTLEEIGQVFNVTRERIRQIEAKILKKLAHPSRTEKLKDCIELRKPVAKRWKEAER